MERKYLHDPIFGGHAGQVLCHERLGWAGIPTPGKLKDLGLEELTAIAETFQ